jgi:uncharacterized protein (TIGR00251 family)
MPVWMTRRDDEVTLALHVQPRSSRDEISGTHGDRLKVRITAPPVDGAANDHLCRYLAQLFGVSPGRVRLIKGAAGRNKLVTVGGVGELPEEIARILPSPGDPVSGQ